jgi:hypothetical protein
MYVHTCTYVCKEHKSLGNNASYLVICVSMRRCTYVYEEYFTPPSMALTFLHNRNLWFAYIPKAEMTSFRCLNRDDLSPVVPPPGYTEFYEKDTGFIVYQVELVEICGVNIKSALNYIYWPWGHQFTTKILPFYVVVPAIFCEDGYIGKQVHFGAFRGNC